MVLCVKSTQAQKQLEKLNRGVVAVRTNIAQVYVGWRLLGTDPEAVTFNVYRGATKVNAAPITNSTNFIDTTLLNETYSVKPIINGIEQAGSEAVPVWLQSYHTIPLQIPAAGVTPMGEAYTYNANDCSVADLDGDGVYEIVLKWDPSNAKDNSQSGYTGNVYIDAYRMNGSRLWRIDLGKNIRAGAHYTQLMVYDLDGDGKAEVVLKTADGTVDGAGNVIGDATKDYRNSGGYILSGPEFLTIFNGVTGAAMATTNFLPARGTVSSWGDSYGNRVDRFISAIAYVDGHRPSLIMGRGYYTRLVRVAWDWRNGQLTHRWTFDCNTPGNGAYYGQGNHQLTVGDVDGDGRDEICNGSSAIDDDGKGLYSNGLGHGDAIHMTDMDPDRPGQEVWMCHEDQRSYGQNGLVLKDGKTGQPLWGVPTTGDIGRCMAADIDPRYKGYEVWGPRGYLYTSSGQQISTSRPSSMNFGLWWDGDLQRELLDGTKLEKWDHTTSTSKPLVLFDQFGAASNNGTKANPGLSADILGDWREEVIYRSTDNTKLLLLTTTIPTDHRLYTLMHDPQYRVQVALQNSAYNQPPHPSFYLGEGMIISRPNITVEKDTVPPVALVKNITVQLDPTGKASITTEQVDNGSYDHNGIAKMELSKTAFDCSTIGENTVQLIVTDYYDNTSTATATITVMGIIPTPAIAVSRTDNTFTGVDDHTILLGYGAQQLTLTASNISSAPGASNYSWNPAAGLSNAAIANPVFTPAKEGAYAYTVTVTNEFGCTATTSTAINVIEVRCGDNLNKVVVCHSGQSICIDTTAVQEHLAHGCSLGNCSNSDVSGIRSNESAQIDISMVQSTLEAYPNPLTSRTTIRAYIADQVHYRIELYNMQGAFIKLLAQGKAQSDQTCTYNLNASDYAQGIYLVKLVTEKQTIVKRIIIQR